MTKPVLPEAASDVAEKAVAAAAVAKVPAVPRAQVEAETVAGVVVWLRRRAQLAEPAWRPWHRGTLAETLEALERGEWRR